MSDQLLPVFPRSVLPLWRAHAPPADELPADAGLHDLPRRKTRQTTLFHWIAGVTGHLHHLLPRRRGSLLLGDFSLRPGRFR